MKLIDISTPKYPNTFTMVDDEDFEWLSKWKWHLSRPNGYVVRKQKKNGKECAIFMHKEILKPPHGMLGDHRFGDKLDNRRENLRICTHSTNSMNRKQRCTNKLAKGVSWHRLDNLFQARVKVNGKRISLGYFHTEAEASAAYNAGAIQYHGEFARLNKLEDMV